MRGATFEKFARIVMWWCCLESVDFWKTLVALITSEREARSEFLLIYTKNLSMSGRPWSRFWEAYISGTISPIHKRFSLVGSPIPSAVYGTNAESCQCLLWHVARATWGMSQMFRLLFLGNGWADCVESWYALGNPLVTTYAVVTNGVPLHVRTCIPRFCISQTARPIEFNFGVRVRGPIN